MLQAVQTSQEPGVGERLLTQRDRRADGGARHVQVTRGDIFIARRFGGIEMMIAAPVAAYRGVGLVTLTDLQGDVLNRVVLVHRDADLDIVLGETRDKAEAQDAWVAWAAWFGLAQLAMQDAEWMTVAMSVEQRQAPLSVAAPVAASIALSGGVSDALSRRPSWLERRRSSFRVRGKFGAAQQCAGVFGKEREIGCSE
jgi:hypothetical protein